MAPRHLPVAGFFHGRKGLYVGSEIGWEASTCRFDGAAGVASDGSEIDRSSMAPNSEGMLVLDDAS